ncbi:MAG: ribosomal protein S18-alanine N-acetyltransferase [Acidobacteria bacterium]|nr:ribosomal protein S18-alanine N-acetyltransferase [Acidobacteriota bacterium]
MRVELQRFLPGHVAQVVALERRCGLETWGAEDYAKMLDSDPTFHGLIGCLQGAPVPQPPDPRLGSGVSDLTGETDFRIIGFIAGRMMPGDVEIYKLAVDPEYRRQGIGRRMMHRFLGMARERGAYNCYLEVRKSNASAIAFYRSLGFVLYQSRPLYYTNPVEDALIMLRRGETGL